MASGDYAVALEPSNVGFAGREDPNVEILQPLQTHTNEWRIEIIEGAENIAALEREILLQQLQKKCRWFLVSPLVQLWL